MASTSETSPEMSPKDTDSGDEMQDMMFAQRGCCHWMPFFASERSKANTSGSIWWERISNAPQEKERTCWSKGLKALKKVREWSELVAGPKWKTFIRQFNKNGIVSGMRNGKFQYDPLSYALNFDDGPRKNGYFDDDRTYPDFSSRYAAIPISAKSSMDLGRDAPLFT